MVGDSANPSGDKPAQRPAPRVKSFSCPKCGASVTIRYPGASLSAVCESCHSVIDTTNENYTILSRYKAKADLFKPAIPLGTRGKLEGRLWEVIGFMVRRDGSYYWEEYLLFNPYYGYRFLVSADRNWNFVEMIKKKPMRSSYTNSVLILDDKRFECFNRGSAEVVHVLGEFYWKVVVGSTVMAEDYICPPLMLSSEKSDSDVVWSLGKYVSPKVVRDAFKLEDLQEPYKVGPNQPNKSAASWNSIKIQWVGFIIILTLIQMYYATSASNTLAYRQSFPYKPNTKASDISSTKFKLDKDLANAKIEISSRVNNSWLWVSGDLVNNSDGSTFPFEQTTEYYYGTDSDGYWSEGSQSASQTLHTVPGGDYYLNFDLESGDFKTTDDQDFSITVWRDIPTWGNYFWCLFLLSILPCMMWAKVRSFEVARWSNSDYSPYEKSRYG